MAAEIRMAVPEGSEAWLDLVRASLGDDHSSKQIYELEWIRSQMDSESGHQNLDCGGGRKTSRWNNDSQFFAYDDG